MQHNMQILGVISFIKLQNDWTLNSSCDFDSFVCILYECVLSAQKSYT